jgi:hypothetical protein
LACAAWVRSAAEAGDPTSSSLLIGEPGSLDRLQRCEHDGEAALHIGDARPAQHSVFEPARLLELVARAVHRIHVAGEEQLHRRRRTDREMKMPAVFDLDRASACIDRLHRCGPFEPDQAGQAGERVHQQIRHAFEAGEVARAAVDRGPAQHLVEHRFGSRAFDDRALVRR